VFILRDRAYIVADRINLNNLAVEGGWGCEINSIPILEWTDSKGHECLQKIVGLKDNENGQITLEHVFRIRQPSGWRGSGWYHPDIFRTAIRHLAEV
jgi:hypothetical protein